MQNNPKVKATMQTIKRMRFSNTDAAILLNHVFGLSLTKKDVAKFCAKNGIVGYHSPLWTDDHERELAQIIRFDSKIDAGLEYLGRTAQAILTHCDKNNISLEGSPIFHDVLIYKREKEFAAGKVLAKQRDRYMKAMLGREFPQPRQQGFEFATKVARVPENGAPEEAYVTKVLVISPETASKPGARDIINFHDLVICGGRVIKNRGDATVFFIN